MRGTLPCSSSGAKRASARRRFCTTPALIALELWDADSWHALASRQVQVARDSGALGQLQFALNFFARSQLASGELNDVAVLVEEERVIMKKVFMKLGINSRKDLRDALPARAHAVAAA